LQQDVGVETQSRHEVNHVDRRLDELHQVWTDLKAVPSVSLLVDLQIGLELLAKLAQFAEHLGRHGVVCGKP
jgi:hypothetical protein